MFNKRVHLSGQLSNAANILELTIRLMKTIFDSLGATLPLTRRGSLRTAALFGVCGLLACGLVGVASSAPMSANAFTYQGRLTARGLPVNGQFDLRLMLFYAMTGTNRVNQVLTNGNVTVTNGLFTTTLDFGPDIFNGLAYFLEVAVRPSNLGGEDFGEPLLPRQRITAAPYALYSINAGFAENASNALNADTAVHAQNADAATRALTATTAATATNAQTAATATSALTATTAATATMAAVAATANSVLWSNVLDKPFGFADGVDDNTLYSAGAGLERNGTEFSVDASIARLSGVWQLGGNGGTSPALNFLGTTDNNALEFKVNGTRALRLEPNSNGPNVIAGDEANAVVTGPSGATIGGGRDNRILPTASYATIPGGLGARARSHGQLVHASGSFAAGAGDAQSSTFVLRGTTTGGATNELFLDGTGARMLVPSNGVWTFDVLVVASTATNIQAGGFQAKGVVKHDGTATSLVGTNRITADDILKSAPPAWNVELTARDAGQEHALVIRVNGGGLGPPQTVRWVAVVRTAEVIFPSLGP
jgi:hypothetical protein